MFHRWLFFVFVGVCVDCLRVWFFVCLIVHVFDCFIAGSIFHPHHSSNGQAANLPGRKHGTRLSREDPLHFMT
jgi:hypothetical protein